ncbi:MAG: hypothetical protein JST75_10875 [Bacteroidetes bacterium]|nr:hypothetical protein [Bacteroidota bacterium]
MRVSLFTFLGLISTLISCKESAREKVADNSANKFSQKIIVYRDNVYDLSGYANDGGNPFNLFDENAFVDPRSERKEDNYIPVTDPQPTIRQSIYFPLHRGSRIVTDLRIPYKISEIYVYDRSHVNDSVWIYTGEMTNWKLKVAFETKSNPGARGWRRFAIDDSTQYVMIRFSSYETNITEMVLYGSPYKTIPPPPVYNYEGPRFRKKMMKEFLGVNYIMETNPRWLQPFHYSRLYNFALDFDNQKSQNYPGVKYNMLHYGYWDGNKQDYVFDIDTLKKINNGIVWYSIRGVAAWMNDKGFTDKDRPVTKIGMDPEDPMSYARHANMMWNMAAFFGSTKVDTNLLSLSHGPGRSGRATMDIYENGNEEDTRWDGSKYCSPLEYFAQSSADYDGHEHALGKFCGIKNADDSGKLMTSGMIELDTNRVKVYKFLSSTLRKDKIFPWKGGIQYHHYSNRNNKAITPEEDSLRWRLAKVRECTYRIQPDVECFLGENGYDKSTASLQGTPMLPGLSAAQSQGIMILRSINATAFSGFDAYILYWLKDGNPETDPRVYLTSGILRQMPDGSTKPYPGWFYISSFVNRLANYTADSIVSEKGNVWVYKYRNQLSPDSVAYFVYCPTRNGIKVDAYPLRVGKAAGDVEEIYFADDSPSGKAVLKKVLSGVVDVQVEEKPKLILVTEERMLSGIY